MSSISCYEYYNYLQYIKNAKVPPIYLNENGYVFATSPIDFSNNTISDDIKLKILINKRDGVNNTITAITHYYRIQ